MSNLFRFRGTSTASYASSTIPATVVVSSVDETPPNATTAIAGSVPAATAPTSVQHTGGIATVPIRDLNPVFFDDGDY